MTTREPAWLTGRLPAELANAVSAAIAKAVHRGMETDEACCVAAAVIADYARAEYGAAYLTELAEVVVQRSQVAPPEFEELAK